jgi:large subunit ribosomal protein L20
MTRVKRGVQANKRRKKIIKAAKGYQYRRKTNYRAAKEAFIHAGVHSYTSRKLVKRTKRAEWQIKINAACRLNGLTYSQFMHKLKLQNILLNRKVLSELAEQEPKLLEAIIKEVAATK